VITFGRRLRSLCEEHGLTRSQAAPALGISTGYLFEVERGQKPTSVRVAVAAADFFGLVDVERAAFLALREAPPVEAPKSGRRSRLPLAVFACLTGCKHDGRMAPGGALDGRDRDETCVHYDVCTSRLLREHPNVATCHCARRCTDKRHPDRAEQIERHTRCAWPEGGV
jgi:transcriptional regulator with XRE-family HTH domain